MIKKGYTERKSGQLHWRVLSPESTVGPDLYCLHPAPYSGLAYTTIMPYLAQGRRVIAPDYPGYGGSYPSGTTASIEQYAEAIKTVMDDLSPEQTCDVLGFHTGCLVASELCLMASRNVRKSVLIDVPAFDVETSQKLKASNGNPLALTPELECLAGPWDSGVTKRLPSQSMMRAFEMFVEQIRPGTSMNAAFYAAFSYPWQEKLPRVDVETLILATQSGLLDGTRAVAKIMPNSTLTERLDITRSVLDEAAEETANEVNRFLG